MKQMILSLCLLISVFCYGQTQSALKDVHSIKFYGVDYSQAKVFGAKEPSSQFITAFKNINNLLITETNKYDVGKYIKKEITEISLDAVNQINENINPHELETTLRQYSLSKDDIEAAIKALPIKPSQGIGMVFLAGLLNKPANNGDYVVVFFNTETKEIIEQWITHGKAGGFGLRNYWAGSLHNAMKKL